MFALALLQQPAPPDSRIEMYRQFATVSSLLAGFAFAYFATMLSVQSQKRLVSVTGGLALCASLAFLVVTLGFSFAAPALADASFAGMRNGIGMHHRPLSLVFLLGIGFLLAAFATGGWVRSRGFGWATTILSLIGLWGISWAMSPFIN